MIEFQLGFVKAKNSEESKTFLKAYYHPRFSLVIDPENPHMFHIVVTARSIENGETKNIRGKISFSAIPNKQDTKEIKNLRNAALTYIEHVSSTLPQKSKDKEEFDDEQRVQHRLRYTLKPFYVDEHTVSPYNKTITFTHQHAPYNYQLRANKHSIDLTILPNNKEIFKDTSYRITLNENNNTYTVYKNEKNLLRRFAHVELDEETESDIITLLSDLNNRLAFEENFTPAVTHANYLLNLLSSYQPARSVKADEEITYIPAA